MSVRLKDFVRSVEKKLALTHIEALGLLGAITVLDNHGTLEDRRAFARERLRPLVDNEANALAHLESLARNGARTHRRLTTTLVRDALVEAQVGIRLQAWAPAIDREAYASRIAADSDRLDTAHLPALDVTVRHFATDSIRQLQPSTFDRLSVLLGPHGSGKSRTASLVARGWISEGRPGLHVRLSQWATNLENLLLAEISAMILPLAATIRQRYWPEASR